MVTATSIDATSDDYSCPPVILINKTHVCLRIDGMQCKAKNGSKLALSTVIDLHKWIYLSVLVAA